MISSNPRRKIILVVLLGFVILLGILPFRVSTGFGQAIDLQGSAGG
jgi:hypothetical protein